MRNLNQPRVIIVCLDEVWPLSAESNRRVHRAHVTPLSRAWSFSAAGAWQNSACGADRRPVRTL